MDYERRRVRWYWVTLFVVYSGAVVYFVLTGNPFLYSHQEYRRALLAAPDSVAQPVPSPEMQLPLPEPIGEQTYFARINSERNGTARSDATYGKNFVEKDVITLPIDEDFHVASWSLDESGIYLAGTDSAEAVSWSGEKLWEFRFSQSGKPLSDILTDNVLSYLVTSNGEVVALNKKNGALQWNLKLNEEVVGPTILSDTRLLVPLKAHSGDAKSLRPAFRWVVIKRATGEIAQYSKVIDVRPKFQFSRAPELGVWILSYDNKLAAVDPEKLEVVWTQTLTDPIRGPATVVGNSLFLSSLAGKVVKLDGAKKGRQEWEVELPRPPISAPSFLPIMGKLSVLDDQGELQLVDAKVGKPLWRYNIESRSDLKETWSARLKGNIIQETSMNWAYRGWSVWAPCSKNRLCIYNPDKGQLINRIQISGSLLSFPIDIDHSLYFLIDQGQKWAISHLEVLKKGVASGGGAAPAGTPTTAPAPQKGG